MNVVCVTGRWESNLDNNDTLSNLAGSQKLKEVITKI